MSSLDDWVSTISDAEMKEVTTKLVALSKRIPYITDRVRDLVWLICMEDKRTPENYDRGETR